MTIADETVEVTRRRVKGQNLTIRQLVPICLVNTGRIIARKKRVHKLRCLFNNLLNKFKLRNMKKILSLFIAIALVAPVFSQEILHDARLIKNGCSYATRDAADVAAHHATIMPDETITDIIVSQNSNGTYCSWSIATCSSPLTHDAVLRFLETNGVDIKSLEIKHIAPAPDPSPLLEQNRKIPALKPYTSCTKTLYGPNIWVGYPSCQDAENGAASWLASKTSVILESVETGQWGSGDGWEYWKVTITYTTGGACYK